MKDEILERWNTISLKERQEMLDKFNVTTLRGVMENQKLRDYIKVNFMRSKLIRRGREMALKCPICNLELKDSMKVLGLTTKGIKEFHLANAHTHNLLHDLVELVSGVAFHHRELGKNIPWGDRAVELNDYAKEIEHAENEKWEGEDENS